MILAHERLDVGQVPVAQFTSDAHGSALISMNPRNVCSITERSDRDKVITVAVHTRKEVGTGLAQRILKEAGL